MLDKLWTSMRRTNRPVEPAPPATVPQASSPASQVEGTCDRPPPGEVAWYPPLMVSADRLGAEASKARTIQESISVLSKIESDPYIEFLKRYYADGLSRFGESWRYADIVTVLVVLAQTIRPRHYLEIGVRTGRSAATVACFAPEAKFHLFDMWMKDYAGMSNPGPDFVRQQLARVGFRGTSVFVDGNSHETLPKYFVDNFNLMFDLVTVDGDHSDAGAAQDIRDVLPRIAVGGAIVFDDIAHPQHPGLRGVWYDTVVSNPQFSSWSFPDLGYGVGFALRRC